MDEIAGQLEEEVIIQKGPSKYRVVNAKERDFLTIEDFDSLMDRSSVVVSHAGVGSIMDAKRHRKPVVVLPRRKELGEMWDNHQLATALELRKMEWVFVAENESQIIGLIMKAREFCPSDEVRSKEKEALIDFIRSIVVENERMTANRR
jgi:UDP-N-acetylglucosamine transferase subunit ALG13